MAREISNFNYILSEDRIGQREECCANNCQSREKVHDLDAQRRVHRPAAAWRLGQQAPQWPKARAFDDKGDTPLRVRCNAGLGAARLIETDDLSMNPMIAEAAGDDKRRAVADKRAVQEREGPEGERAGRR